MARTQKDVVSYFPHYADACTGDTLMVLQSRFGNDGYAFWFKLLEKLASTDGHCLDCSNSTKWQLLLAKTGVNEITGVDIMKLLVEMQAIDKELWDSRLIWCQKLVDNIADVYKNRRREIPQKPIITDKKRITTGKNGITTGQSTQTKVKQTKVNKSIVDNNISNSKDTTIKDKNIYHLFEQEIGMLTPMIAEQLKEAESVFPDDWIKDAIKEAARANVRKWRYVEGILKRWATDGRDVKMSGQTIKPSEDPDKYVKGKYGHMVRRK